MIPSETRKEDIQSQFCEESTNHMKPRDHEKLRVKFNKFDIRNNSKIISNLIETDASDEVNQKPNILLDSSCLIHYKGYVNTNFN
jgi:hypothetical protein